MKSNALRRVALVLPALLACLAAACAGAPEAGPVPRGETARAALAHGDTERAGREAKLAIQADPLDAEAHFTLACTLAQGGRRDQAIVGFQRAWRIDPAHPAAAFNAGTLLLEKEEAVAAAGWLENAVWSHPAHVPAYNNLGKAYFLAGLPELAVAAYEQALRLDPANRVALDNLVTLHEAAGAPERAEPYRRVREALDDAGRGASAVHAGRAGPRRREAGSTGSTAPTFRTDAPAAAGAPSPGPAPGPEGARADRAQDAAPPDLQVLREQLAELPHVQVELRGGRPTLGGWTRGPQERALLERVLAGHAGALDLTTDDSGDPQRMLEIDATIFIVTAIARSSVGFDFLQSIQFNYDYFSANHERDGTGFAAPGTIGAVTSSNQSGSILSASVDYDVTIANAVDERVAVLARPHLTTLSGTPASFLAGGEFVFSVSGNISGDIKPYPFGTTLSVTPTLLRTPGEDGAPRVHLAVEAGRSSVLDLLAAEQVEGESVIFDKVQVTGQAVLDVGRTLILSGLSQKERRTGTSGVPILGSIPLLKYIFSKETSVEVDTAVIILLTPRDPAYMGARNRAEIEAFVEKRRAYVEARQGSEEDFRRFEERYPDWNQLEPNRFASHFFLMANSEIYRAASGHDLDEEGLDFDPLGPAHKP